jgi:hypothetical protein
LRRRRLGTPPPPHVSSQARGCTGRGSKAA